MLASAYILHKNRKALNQTHDTTCPLCSNSEEDMAHVLISCRHTRNDSDPWLKATLSHVPLVFADHHHNWSAQELAHLVRDPSHPTVEEMLPVHRDTIHLIEKETRFLCFILHRCRAIELGFRP